MSPVVVVINVATDKGEAKPEPGYDVGAYETKKQRSLTVNEQGRTHGTRCVLARTRQKRNFCMVSTRV